MFGKNVASIDVGTTKVCTVLASVDIEGGMVIIGTSTIPSRGLWKGEVVNVEEASKSIISSVRQIEETSGVKVSSAYVGITGNHINCLNGIGTVSKTRNLRFFSPHIVGQAMESIRDAVISPNEEVIHVIPRSYVLDGVRRFGNPAGTRGVQLDMETHVIVGNISRIQNLLKSVEEAGIKVKGLVLEPLASSEAVLTKEEMQSGVVLADIGGGSTDVASFKDGSIWQTTVLAVAGNHITNDIATCLDTPFRSAENLKVQYGHALPEAVDPNEELEIESFSDRSVRRIKRRELCEIIRARVQETLLIIGQRIKQGGGLNTFPPYGLVITGGTASLPGIAELAQKILHTSVRVGVPMGIPGLDSSLSNPAFATSMGILLWKLTHEDAEQKMDQMGFRNYFNQFNDQVLSRMKQPQAISPTNLKKNTKPQVIRVT